MEKVNEKDTDTLCCVTSTAPVNIAMIKYWGKKDTDLIIPLNGSLSATLDQGQLCAKTSVAISRSFKNDRLWLNGTEQSIDNPRIQSVLNEMRRRIRKRKFDESDLSESFTQGMSKWHLHIVSVNNFPTAAGLASSAAGYACLVHALSKLFNIEGEVSSIARVGSGSACRSMYGGWVEWLPGEDTGSSIAVQVAPEDHWPEIRVLILVVNDQKKPVGSTDGMQATVRTSDLMQYRAKKVVPKRINMIKKAIFDKDFETFAEVTMKESNQLHAVCMDTHPPIFYMNDTSKQIIRFVHDFNNEENTIRAAYTFDAGPNACIFLLEENVKKFISSFSRKFPPSSYENYIRGIPVNFEQPTPATPVKGDLLKYIIHTKVGAGPAIVGDEAESLIGNDGLPK
ncbi:unnamed protein product [Owenia fusiformis]|uniref:Diphosphomevalonate decarboxylase n=1 Tax=Owenia fusiformis TaxID=6347 RepID=A0A8J1XR31_OWEFU|nr:unnamed protein product [Owenia fusiformis]